MSEYNIISVSGGKDSTALLLLAMERQPDNMQAVFADTGNEHPQTYDYVRYLEQVTGVPIRWVKADFSEKIKLRRERLERIAEGLEQDKFGKIRLNAESAMRIAELLQPTGIPFLDLCLWKGRFPSSQAAFCSEELKRNPIMEQVQLPLLDAGHDVISWQGVRADESPRRAKLTEQELKLTRNDCELWNYRPILKWTAQDCFDMHRKHGIQHNPLYEQGMGRVGCMPCINCRKDELLEISKRFPDEVERIYQWEQAVAEVSKRGGATFFSSTDLGVLENNETTLVKANIHKFVEWAQTARGGKQYDFIRMQDEGPLCSSIYGLCE